jgi:hypothetical protein
MIMQNRSDNTFDKLLKAKFENFRSEPSPELWEQISKQLDQKPKSSRLPYVWLTAACLLIVGAYVVWFSSSNTVNLEPQVVKNRISANPVEQLQPASQAIVPSIAESSAKKVVLVVQRPQVKQEPLIASKELVTEQVFNSVEKPVSTTEVQSEAIMAISETPVLANIESEKSETEEHFEEESPSKHRSRGLGRLVNFVVGQVDGRADKLIEVSEDPGEGLRITGLNIGLIKMKNKNPK